MIHFESSHCHKKLRTDATLAQHRRRWRTRCPQCRELIDVPRTVGALSPRESSAQVVEYVHEVEYPDTDAGYDGNQQSLTDSSTNVPMSQIYPDWEDGERRT